MSGFVALTEAQEKRLVQFEHFRNERRALLLRSARAKTRMLLADAIVRHAPRRRTEAQMQVRLLRAKADAIEQAPDHAAAMRWFDHVAARALRDVLGD